MHMHMTGNACNQGTNSNYTRYTQTSRVWVHRSRTYLAIAMIKECQVAFFHCPEVITSRIIPHAIPACRFLARCQIINTELYVFALFYARLRLGLEKPVGRGKLGWGRRDEVRGACLVDRIGDGRLCMYMHMYIRMLCRSRITIITIISEGSGGSGDGCSCLFSLLWRSP